MTFFQVNSNATTGFKKLKYYFFLNFAKHREKGLSRQVSQIAAGYPMARSEKKRFLQPAGTTFATNGESSNI